MSSNKESKIAIVVMIAWFVLITIVAYLFG